MSVKYVAMLKSYFYKWPSTLLIFVDIFIDIITENRLYAFQIERLNQKEPFPPLPPLPQQMHENPSRHTVI